MARKGWIKNRSDMVWLDWPRREVIHREMSSPYEGEEKLECGHVIKASQYLRKTARCKQCAEQEKPA